MQRVTWCAVAFFAFVAVGCGDDDGGGSGGTGASAGSSASGSGGNAGTSGTGGNGGIVAPPTWDRTGRTCGALGQSCDSCDADSICYALDPESCVPRGPAIALRCSVGNCTSDEPYCIHEHCMTEAEAACFCTSSPGSSAAACQLTPQQHIDAHNTANQCVDIGAACGAGIANCCDDSTCIVWPDQPAACAARCQSPSDCDSGCCVPLSTGSGSICAEAERCACQDVGGACGPDGDGTPCCSGTRCVATGGNPFACAQTCTNPSDCESGCCRPLSTGDGNICDEAIRCQCSESGEACGAGNPSCCAGNLCVTFGSDPAACAQTCTDNTDCESNCCQTLSNSTDRICAPAANCSP